MAEMFSSYPDLSGIFARKERGRREAASLSFAEKLALLDAMRDRVAPIIRAREQRRHILQERASAIHS